MPVNLYASLHHYAEHLWPIWCELPEGVRGQAWSANDTSWWGHPARGLASIDAAPGPVLVASHADAVSATCRGRQLIYVEHGAGQTYDGCPEGQHAAGLSSSRDRAMANVVLFLCPNETVAARWRASQPRAAVAVVGCPKLDDWHATGGAKRPSTWSYEGQQVVAVTFHWDSSLVPETMTAWPEYDYVLPRLAAWCADADVVLLGHGHPRIWPRLRRRWEQILEVVPTEQLGDVLDHADVLVADNTSAMYEFASLGRPVVALNASGYRRDVEHGLRFWSHVPGIQVDDPEQLLVTVQQQLADSSLGLAERHAATAAAYAHTDGRAAERAAHAITEVLR